MHSWYWAAALLAITFVSRWWPRLVRPAVRSSDTYYHLLQAEQIRNCRFRMPRQHPRFVLPGEYNYPPAYHYLLALFPREARAGFEKMSSALFDTLLVAVFIWLAIRQLQPAGWSVNSLFLLGLCFTLNPAHIGRGTGPRAYEGTPRTMSEALSGIVFVCLWQYGSGSGWAALVSVLVALLAGSLLLNTSKFGAQALLFFSCLMAFGLNSATLLVFPPLCMVGAIVMSKGNYWRVLTAQIRHLRLYATTLVDQIGITQARKQWRWPQSRQEISRFFLQENVLSVLVLKFAIPLSALGLMAWHPDRVEAYPAAWLLSAFVVFAITSTPRFLFLGEADRYLEYALIPAFLVLAAYLDPGQRDWVLLGIAVLHGALYVFYAGYLFAWRRKPPVDLFGLVAFMKTCRPSVVLSILRSAPWLFVYLTPHQVCFAESLNMSQAEYERFFWRYPLPQPDLRHYVESYQVRLIAVSKEAVETARQQGCVYDFTGLDKIFENDAFLAYYVPEGYLAADEADRHAEAGRQL